MGKYSKFVQVNLKIGTQFWNSKFGLPYLKSGQIPSLGHNINHSAKCNQTNKALEIHLFHFVPIILSKQSFFLSIQGLSVQNCQVS